MNSTTPVVSGASAISSHLAVRPDWLDKRREAALEPGLPIVDPHHHLIDRPESGRYLLPDLLAAYRDRLLDHQNIVRAEVATAAPLAPDRASAIERSLARVTGRTVRLSTRVEPALIGGIVARVGGTVYDASVRVQLQKLRQKLIETT